jgi:hypothetical protein
MLEYNLVIRKQPSIDIVLIAVSQYAHGSLDDEPLASPRFTFRRDLEEA